MDASQFVYPTPKFVVYQSIFVHCHLEAVGSDPVVASLVLIYFLVNYLIHVFFFLISVSVACEFISDEFWNLYSISTFLSSFILKFLLLVGCIPKNRIIAVSSWQQPVTSCLHLLARHRLRLADAVIYTLFWEDQYVTDSFKLVLAAHHTQDV